jgi:DNA-binding CsgD family transcriptional regulator
LLQLQRPYGDAYVQRDKTLLGRLEGMTHRAAERFDLGRPSGLGNSYSLLLIRLKVDCFLALPQAMVTSLSCLTKLPPRREKVSAKRRLSDQDGARALSRRQRRVIELVAQGLKNREIVIELGIAEPVVKKYLREIYAKIGVSNRVELTLWYWSRKQEGNPPQ